MISFRIGYSGEFLPRAIVRTELYNDEGENIEVFDNTLSADDFYFRLVDFFQNLFYKYAFGTSISFMLHFLC